MTTSEEQEAITEYNAKRRAIGLLPISLVEAKRDHHPGFSPDTVEDRCAKMQAAGDELARLLEFSKRGPLISSDIDNAIESWEKATAC